MNLKKSILLALIQVVLFIPIKAQCPDIVSSDMTSLNCGGSPCDVCPGDMLTFNAAGFDLPDAGCINWYYSTTPSFDPYAGQGTLMGCSNISTPTLPPCTICPSVLGILIDGCGGEQNEYMIFSSGSGFSVDDLMVDFDTNNNWCGTCADIGAGCGLQFPTVGISGCSNVNYVGPGTNIPANALVVLFTSSLANSNDDFGPLCGGGEPIYVIQSNCSRQGATTAVGAFSNGGTGARTTNVSFCSGCSQSIVYDRASLPGMDGDYWAQGAIGNAGCGTVIPVNFTPAPPTPSTVTPFNYLIDQALCNGGPYYVIGIVDPDPATIPCPQVTTFTHEFNVQCPTASISGINQICSGQNTTLFASGGGTYLWDNFDMNDQITVQPMATTSYQVTVTLGGCEDVASYTVTVDPQVFLTLGAATLCETDNLYNLQLLEDPAYGGGVWMGPGVVGTNQFDPFSLSGYVTLTYIHPDPCVADAMTDILVNLEQTPQLATASICQNDPPYNLDQLLDPSFQQGSWIGPNVTGTFFDPSSSSGSVSFIFNSSANCVADAMTDILVNPTGTPVLLSDTICENSGLFDLRNISDPNFTSGTWVGSAVTGSQFNPSGNPGMNNVTFQPTSCGDTVTTTILVLNTVTPVLSTDTICEGTDLYLGDLLSSPMSGTWGGNNIQSDTFISSGQAGTNPFTFQGDGDCVQNVSTNVLVSSNLVANIDTVFCDLNNDNYIVEIEISGGIPSTYMVDGNPGTLSGSHFTSDPIISGNSFAFKIWDNSGCDTLNIVGAFDCDCMTNAGTMDFPAMLPLEFCVSQTAIVGHNNNHFLDGNDTIQFVIHDNAGNTLGTIFDLDSIPEFDFIDTTMVIGTTYYISAVAGDDDGTGNVDLSDTCLSVAPGIPVVFSPVPNAILATEGGICNGDTFNLQLILAGQAPFVYQLAIDGVNQPFQGTNLGVLNLVLAPDTTVTYELTYFSDSICVGNILDTFSTITVYPTLNLNFLDTIFYGNGTYSAVFNVTGGDSTHYVFTGTSGIWNDTTFTTNPIPCGTMVDLCVADSVNNCTISCYSNTFNCASVCTTFAGVMGTDTVQVCQTDTAFLIHQNEVLDSNDLLQFVLHDAAGTVLGTIYETSNLPYFTFNSGLSVGTVYYMSAIAGNDDGFGNVDLLDSCLSVATGTPLVFHGFPDLSAKGDATICAMDTAQIELTFQGTAPFTFEYEINGSGLMSMTTNSNPFTFAPVFNSPSTVVFTRIQDAYCVASVSDSVQIDLYDPISISNVEYKCDTVNMAGFTVRFTVSGGVPGTYQFDGTTSVFPQPPLGSNIFETDLIPSNAIFLIQAFDVNQCDTAILSSTFDCSCQTFAGSIDPNFNQVADPFTICGADSVLIPHLGDSTLVSGDIFQYLISDQPAPAFGNIITYKTVDEFGYEPGIAYGQTYYVTAVAGPDDGSGMVDTSAMCFSFSNSIALVFYANPQAFLTVDFDVCQGYCVPINVSLIGSDYPMDFEYHIINGTDTTFERITGFNSPNYTQVYCPPGVLQSEIVLTSISSVHCGPITLNNQSAVLNVRPTVIADLREDRCVGDTVLVNNVVFDVNHPQDTIIFPNAAQNGCDSIVAVDLTFIQPGFLSIDTTICENDFIVVNNVRYDINRPSGMDTLSNGICDSIISVNLQFTPLAMGTHRDTLCAADSLVLGNTTFNLANPSGIATITRPGLCDSLVTVDLEFRPVLQATISGSNQICRGDSTLLTINLTGIASADVTVNNTIVLNGISNNHTFWVAPISDTDYSITAVNVVGNACPTQINGQASVTVSNLSTSVQTSDFQGFSLSCNASEDGSIIVLASNGNPTYTISWADGLGGFTRNNLDAGMYYYTVTDASNCVFSDSVLLTEPQAILFDVTEVSPNCNSGEEGQLIIEMINGGAAPFEFNIENGPFQPLDSMPFTISSLRSGSYDIGIMDANGCVNSGTYTVPFLQLPQVNLGPDRTLALGDSLTIIPSTNIQPDSAVWEPSDYLRCSNCLVTKTGAPIDTKYRLTIFDAEGCSAYDEIEIIVLKNRPIFVPAAFTPNDDGSNDFFTIFGGNEAVRMKVLQVYDRWGSMVYQAKNIELNVPNLGWDGTFNGKKLDPAVFIFYAEIEFLDGEVEIVKGDITLIK